MEHEFHKPRRKKLPVIGWREWISLPELGIDKIKAKVDTGARTSALHAFALRPFKENNKHKIRFDIHPWQHDISKVVTCVADVIDKRWVTDSGGHREERYVICTPIMLANYIWPIEITPFEVVTTAVYCFAVSICISGNLLDISTIFLSPGDPRNL